VEHAQVGDARNLAHRRLDLGVVNSLGQPPVRLDIARARAARYGLNTGDVNAVVQAAVGGAQAGALFEQGSDRNFPIIVRLQP
ncbi:hypothetical protein P0Y36_24310, partial [Salmonella enterica subsp. enterica serovar Isangi]|uniref:hypothetical protein n=1 Tax=Salmonella enterica TaxID=28901 RepID=UPI00345D9031